MQPPFGVERILFDFSMLDDIRVAKQGGQYQNVLCVSLSNQGVIGYFT